MRFTEGCPCCGAFVSRRSMLQAGLATAVAASVPAEAVAQAQSPVPLGRDRVTAVDIHAHYFPQSFLELMAREGPRFGYGADIADNGFTVKSPARAALLPRKFIDLELRMADMDRQGIMIDSDYCFDMGYEHPVEIVDELDLAADARAMILGGTAAK